MLLRILLQDALSEVTNNLLPLETVFFVDDITALVKGRKKEVAEMAKTVMKKLKEELEKKGLKLSVTENGKEGKSKMIAASGFLEKELSHFRNEEGVTLADSVETLGVDLRTRVKSLGAKEKGEEEEMQGEVSRHWLLNSHVPHLVALALSKLRSEAFLLMRPFHGNLE